MKMKQILSVVTNIQTLYKNQNGEAEIDSIGKVKMRDVTDSESKNRRNYQRGNVINFLDGDSLSQSSYGYGVTTLISDQSRVYKGGSWNDRPYWLSPGTRRFLEEDQSLSTLGFRCAMDRMGSPEGNKRKTGNWWKSKRQNSAKNKLRISENNSPRPQRGIFFLCIDPTFAP